ncbi:MAG: Choline-sulfatase [Myxococcaceae bacterium]|nr:Choline-sulfatase [Myxococcaceae bacterium]
MSGPRFGRLISTLGETGAVLLAWLCAIAAEHLAVGFGWRDLIVGSWEMGAARTLVTPIALALLVPAAFVVRALAAIASRTPASGAARATLAAVGALGAGAVALGVSTGRHMESIAVRAPFVAVVAVLACLVVYALAPVLARRAEDRPGTVAWLGALLAIAAWLADDFVLPRLYPAFHAALLAIVLLGSAAVALPLARSESRLVRAITIATLVFSVECALLVPRAARRLRSVDNLRLVLLEHAPLMGRAVLVAALVAPPEELDQAGGGVALAAPGEIPRALDWSGRDVVLLSIDALRADHVGAYGYRRGTTPNIDALAARGVVFESAYCPTPHTSYSVTSMMTGKYMRPLLALGLGEDSDTWAALLRRYDYRTAAFYPPAVFFIDATRFTDFDRRGLDFEYRKVEFAPAALRASQVASYLGTLPVDRPLFLWVHLFEPHEPYEMHAEHPYGRGGESSAMDAYDSEIAAADEGVGAILAKLATRSRKATVIVTADHGEEFGEHGGRYHGTTVYEEQVRVPLVIAGPGIPAHRVTSPVQTIDLLPTTLSALGIPRPARIRGRDLGPRIADAQPKPGAVDDSVAFAETDDYTLVAKKELRLVCARKAGACALYDAKTDPGEKSDLSPTHAREVAELRQLTVQIAAEHGRFERGKAQDWPEALRRGMQGEIDAAEEVAALLDDARLDVRRKAAEVTFDLHAPVTAPHARRALASTEDAEVRGHVALALARMPGESIPPEAERLLAEGDPAWKRKAALALAERGDARGGPVLAAWWAEEGRRLPFDRAKELLAALAAIKEKSAVSSLVAALGDVRLRPFVADALGAIGDPTARAPLLEAFSREPYLTTRGHEARALLALGARAELREPLARFAGMPEPMFDAIRVAHAAGLLDAPQAPPRARALRLLVLTDKPGQAVAGTVAGQKLGEGTADGDVVVFEIGALDDASDARVDLTASGEKAAIRAFWLVSREPELPPPPPEAWDAGDGDVDPRGPGK